MDTYEEIVAQIKKLCTSVTESNYENGVQQGRQMLVQLHDLGFGEKCVYESLLQYYNSLEDGLPRDCLGDIMDFVVGWCAPQNHIWKEDEMKG